MPARWLTATVILVGRLDRIIASSMKRMTFAESLYKQPATSDKPIAGYGLLSILRASRIETTGWREERREI